MDQLAAQALAGADGAGDIETQIEQALSCPCVGESVLVGFIPAQCEAPPLSPPPAPLLAGDLKEGPCGSTFVEAFSCFIRSEHPDRGMDCIPQFQSFQECLKRHPDHVEKIMNDAEEDAGESTTEVAGPAATADASKEAEKPPQ